MEILKDYIAYARTHVQPIINEEAGQYLIEAYVEMRKVGSGRGQVSAYPRQLESLIRLAEAHAKMRLSNNVEVVDVQEAKRYSLLKQRTSSHILQLIEFLKQYNTIHYFYYDFVMILFDLKTTQGGSHASCY